MTENELKHIELIVDMVWQHCRVSNKTTGVDEDLYAGFGAYRDAIDYLVTLGVMELANERHDWYRIVSDWHKHLKERQQ